MRASVNIEEICNKAADAAIKRFKDKEREEKKKARFRNTELLLRNYNKFIAHIDNAIDSIDKVSDFYDVNDEDDELFIMSIRRTKYRTLIMISHIEAAMDELRKQHPEKYRIIEEIYINNKTFEKLAEEMFCSEITIRRWKNEMIDELSIYLFGTDGMKIEM